MERIKKIVDSVIENKKVRDFYFSYPHNEEKSFDGFFLSLVYRFHWRMRDEIGLTKEDCRLVTKMIHYNNLKFADIDFKDKKKMDAVVMMNNKWMEYPLIRAIKKEYENRIN